MNDKLEEIVDDELMNIQGGDTRNFSWLGEKINEIWSYLFGDD